MICDSTGAKTRGSAEGTASKKLDEVDKQHCGRCSSPHQNVPNVSRGAPGMGLNKSLRHGVKPALPNTGCHDTSDNPAT